MMKLKKVGVAGLLLYFPLITEEGIVNFKNYSEVLRFNINFNLGSLF